MVGKKRGLNAMIQLLSLLTGALIAVMLVLNGVLTQGAGAYSATVIIHVVGLVAAAALVLGRKRAVGPKPQAHMYLGGVIGVATTVLSNLAFGHITMTALLALCLFGQSLTSICIDQLGLMGMKKRPFTRGKALGLCLTVAGIVVLALPLQAVKALPLMYAFASGVTIVVARTMNAGLAQARGVRWSSFMNYVAGLAGSVLMLLMVGRGEPMMVGGALPATWWAYAGGLLGVAVTLLSNHTVSRISAFAMTLLLFVSQVGTGLALDYCMLGSFSLPSLGAGILVAAGLVVMNK